MTRQHLQSLLDRIRATRIGVLGDWCLDIYWIVDPARSEVSLETGLATHPVREQRYSLGGAGNVVSNLVALGCGDVRGFGVVGDDPWGREMLGILREAGVNTCGMLRQKAHWATLAYTKPYIGDAELNRLDFGNFNSIEDATADELIKQLEASLASLDVVVVNQQVQEGIHSGRLRSSLRALIHRHPETVFIADSRHFSDAFTGASVKLNDHEAARLTGVHRAPEELVLRDEAVLAAEELFQRFKTPVYVTRGARGVIVRDAVGLSEIPGLQILGQTDPVGAGDSMLAGIACALAAGETPESAARLGNFAAAVTIQKLRQTGTAGPDEIIAIGADPDYVYRPELAEDPRQASYIEGAGFEVVNAARIPSIGGGAARLTHAIFDHDGTISTLRQGWEEIMEPMMVKAILGPRFTTADESLYHSVVARVREYIDQSTGIQTLVQMQGLVKLVRQFACVPEDQVLDEAGYKEIYNEALLAMTRARLSRLRAGELSVEDFTVKGAVRLLESLSAAGVRLYLASGTDEADVNAEAEALGYAPLFEGRVYGARGDLTHEAKRVVLDRILSDVGGKASLVTFGDGPVEMRETCKRGGLAVGVASDEVRRYGQNPAKRTRLIRAGADLVIPDFSQLPALLNLLRIPVDAAKAHA